MEEGLNYENGSFEQTEQVSQTNETEARTESETVVNNGEDKVIASAEREDGTSRFSVYEDPETGKRYVKSESVTENPEQGNDTDTSAIENEPEYNTPQPNDLENEENIQGENTVQPYSLDEFSYAIASNSVDEARVPQEFKQQYGNFKVNQAIEEYNRRKDEATALARTQIQKQLTPEEMQTARKDFFREVDSQAKELALRDLGMTAEEYENAQYDDQADQNLTKDYETAYAWHRSELMNKVHQMAHNKAAYQNQQKNIYNDIVAFRETEKATEKNFNEIDRIMTQRYLFMPYKTGKIVSEAIAALQNGTITPNQALVIQKYYEDTKKEYYARKAGLSRSAPNAATTHKAPPAVEGSGSGKEAPDTPRFTTRDLRNANNLKDKLAIFTSIMNDRKAR